MCGIFGIISKTKNWKESELQNLVNKLYLLSESRGKESSGIAIKNYSSQKISVLKKSLAASELIKSNEYKSFWKESTQGIFGKNTPFVLIAHARLVTNGSHENNNNNQPVIKDEVVAVHNGIITNVEELWKAHSSYRREYEVDTEFLLKDIQAGKGEIHSRIQKAFQKIEGTVSCAIVFQNSDLIFLGTNNGSLYYYQDKDFFVFASEDFILSKALESFLGSIPKVNWMSPRVCAYLSLQGENLFQKTNLSTEIKLLDSQTKGYQIVNYSPDEEINLGEVFVNPKETYLRSLLEYPIDKVKQLKRCKKCILPETFPFIQYDSDGVCNYCNSYIPKRQGEREAEFKKFVEQYKKNDGTPDCIVPFSGGRDSSYGLHYIVKDLGLHPITYTYDWGMVTDLARRNIARVCGKLGIENIIISADIKRKRENIRKNVLAWLKKPRMGIIPLFMAGDKQFFYFVNVLKKQTGIQLDIWSTNILENTDFKAGFCGVKPTFDKTRPDYLPFKSKYKMIEYYMLRFLENPRYINSSLWDTFRSFLAYYAEPRTHFYQLFDYVKWEESKIENTIVSEYNWEFSPDTTTSWRIGDGTAPFYNYIYYTVAGFTENDTFRSNQIREGLISREEAIEKVYLENRPRYESLVWYFNAIQIDFENSIKVVNSIPRLY
jgi:asparagine synthetase B (glutamine-hydrolysing)